MSQKVEPGKQHTVADLTLTFTHVQKCQPHGDAR